MENNLLIALTVVITILFLSFIIATLSEYDKMGRNDKS